MPASEITPIGNIFSPQDSYNEGRTGERYVKVVSETKKNLFGRKKSTWWRVSTDLSGKPPVVSSSSSIPLDSPDGEGSVSLYVNFRAICPDNNAEKAAQRLCKYGDPASELDALICGELNRQIWSNSNTLFDNFNTSKISIEKDITDYIYKESGLSLKIILDVKNSDLLSSREYDMKIETRFIDSAVKSFIHVQCNFDILFGNDLRAVLNLPSVDNLDTKFSHIISEYIRLNVKAQEFASGLRSTRFLEKIKDVSDEFLNPQGRCISGLLIKPEDIEISTGPIELPLDHYVKPLGRIESIQLSGKAKLQLVDLATYQRADSPSLNSWVADAFRIAVQDACFEKQYTDYLLDGTWDSIEEHIREFMKVEAEKIGFALQQIVSAPVLPENKFKKMQNHEFSLTDLPLKAVNHSTRAALFIAASFQLSDWEHEDLLDKVNREVDIADDIKLTLDNAARSVLNSIDPNEYYFNFDGQNQIFGNEGISSVYSRLKEVIKEALSKNYGAVIATIEITQKPTDEMAAVLELINASDRTTCKITSLDKSIHEMEYTLSWKITNPTIGSWDIISRPGNDFQSIKAEIKLALTAALQAQNEEVLRSISVEDQNTLLSEINYNIKNQISLKHGVDIQLISLSRESSDIENKVLGYKKHEIVTQINNETKNTENEFNKNELTRNNLIEEMKNETKIHDKLFVELQELNNSDKPLTPVQSDRKKQLEEKLETIKQSKQQLAVTEKPDFDKYLE